MRWNESICEKCENYLMRKNEDGAVTTDLCLAMSRMLEILSILKIPNNETQIPFETSEVPSKCR